MKSTRGSWKRRTVLKPDSKSPHNMNFQLVVHTLFGQWLTHIKTGQTHLCVVASCGFVSEMHFWSFHACLVDFPKNSRFRVTWLYNPFKEGVNASVSIFKMAVWYLLLSPCLCPVIFYLNGFNSVLTSCCQRTEMARPLSFRSHQSFIITTIHQPILVITDYKQPVMWQDQGNTHTHTLLWCSESETHLHIRRSETCSLPAPSFHRGAT